MDSQSLLLDLVTINGDPGDAEAITGSASVISQHTAQLNGIVNANGQDVDYYFEYGPTTQYGDISDVFSTTANQDISIAVSGLCRRAPYTISGWCRHRHDTINGNDRSFETAPADGSAPRPRQQQQRRRWRLFYRLGFPVVQTRCKSIPIKDGCVTGALFNPPAAGQARRRSLAPLATRNQACDGWLWPSCRRCRFRDLPIGHPSTVD